MIFALQIVIAFIIVLGPLVFIHELGHFLVAKAFKIGVPVFSIGFGPRLFGFHRGGTDYRVSAIPLGGYVRLAGDEADENRTGAPDEFLTRPKWQRFFVFVAGAVFNVVLAFVTFWFLFAVFGKPEVPEEYPVVMGVEQGSPAEEAGVQTGDRIVAVSGRDVKDPQEFSDAWTMDVILAPNTTKTFTLEREGVRLELDVFTGSDPDLGGLGQPGLHPFHMGTGEAVIGQVIPGDPADQAGILENDRIVGVEDIEPISQTELRALLAASPDKSLTLRVERGDERIDVAVVPRRDGEQGRIGVTFRLPEFPNRKLGIVEAARESVRTNLSLSKTLFVFLKRVITRQVSGRAVSGPVGIAHFARQALLDGPDRLLQLIGFFSLQLGILNLLPIPVLDGGHIMILGIEGVIRRDLPEIVKERVMQVGFLFLLSIMCLVMWMDIDRFGWLNWLKWW